MRLGNGVVELGFDARTGALRSILDQAGGRFLAVIKELNRRRVLVDLEKPLPSPGLSPVRLTLCQALLKSNPMDLLVEKASELGVDRILPYIADRTVVRVDGEKAQHNPQSSGGVQT